MKNFLIASSITCLVMFVMIYACKKPLTNDQFVNKTATLVNPLTTTVFTGLYACTPQDEKFPTGSPTGFSQYCWSSTYIDGVVERDTWAFLMPNSTTTNFSFIGTECFNAIKYGKKIMLDIYGGENAPTWAYTTSTTLYIQANGSNCYPMPQPWDAVYQGNWALFMERLSYYLNNNYYTVGSTTTPYIDAIAGIKVGGCCTEYTSELRVPNQSCSSGTASCCPINDATIWQGLSNYTVSDVSTAIETMINKAIYYFPNKVIGIPVISAGAAFPESCSTCTDCPSYPATFDCITPAVFAYLGHVLDPSYFLGMYEALKTNTMDGSICQMLVGTTGNPGMVATTGCQLGYQLDASIFGKVGSPIVDCNALYSALTNGYSQGARYFEVFQQDFEVNCVFYGDCSCDGTEGWTDPAGALAAFHVYLMH